MFGLLDQNNVLIQKQPNNQEGFVSIPNDAVCGQIMQGDGSFINPPAEDISKQSAKDLIDISAGHARGRFIAKGSNIADEYTLALAQTKAWRLEGSPANEVPLSISDWANATGITDEQAASAIESAASNMEALLLTIRKIRLEGKAAVDAATSGNREAAQLYIDQLDAL